MRFGLRASSSRRLRRTEGRGGSATSLLDGSQHVVHIHNQHRRAVFHERRGADVFDLAETGIERLHDQFAFAQKPIHDHAIARGAVAQHHDGQIVAGRFGCAGIEDLMGGYQTDLPAGEMEMVPAFEGFDSVPLQLHGVDDLTQREGVWLIVHLDQQGAQHGERERQLQLEPASRDQAGW